MSIVIYTYHDPYKIDQEPYWDEIKNCPYFCSAQTLVNGLRSHYKEKFDGGRVSTVKILTDSLYVDWASTAWIVKQHTDIDNIINSGFSTDLSESEQINIGRAFLFNRDDVFTSIRTMFELNVDPSAILKNKLTKEQRFILGIYQKILASEMKKDFYLARSLAEEEIDEGLRRAMTAKQEDYDFSDVNLDTIVIHGVHQFNPIMLRAIDELQKYKNVILLFNYQKQYKNVYQTWFDIYSAFDCKIIDCDRNEFLATDSSTVSYKGNVLADQLGKLVNGQRRAITVGDPYEIIEFDNMTEFAGYVADIFEEAERKDPQKPIRLSEDEEKAIEFISKKLASGKRIHELELLKRTLQYHHGIIGRLQKHLSEKYHCEMDEYCTENVINMMTNEFPTSAAKKTYAQCVFLKKEQDDYGISDSYEKMLQNPEFCAILEELVDFGISRYKVNYSYHYQDTNLVLYQKYTYEDACRLLNWERNEVPLNIGGYKYDKKTKTFPIFINYDKQDNISDTTKYEDHFISENRLIAISKSGRSMDSEDVQNFLNATERGIDVQLFVRKNKDDKISKEFYYLGRVIATGNAKQFVMPNTDKTAVEIEWELETPVREDIYQYIVNE